MHKNHRWPPFKVERQLLQQETHMHKPFNVDTCVVGYNITERFPFICSVAEDMTEVECVSTFMDEFKKAHNLRYLGSGVAGAVYGNKAQDYVYKLFDLDDIGYMIYLSHALRNQEKATVPTIYGIRIFRTKALVCMEKLQASTKVIRGYNRRDDVIDTLWDISRGRPTDANKSKRFSANDIAELQDTFKKLKRQSDGTFADLDLHDGNFMFRGNQLVLTDPLY